MVDLGDRFQVIKVGPHRFACRWTHFSPPWLFWSGLRSGGRRVVFEQGGEFGSILPSIPSFGESQPAQATCESSADFTQLKTPRGNKYQGDLSVERVQKIWMRKNTKAQTKTVDTVVTYTQNPPAVTSSEQNVSSVSAEQWRSAVSSRLRSGGSNNSCTKPSVVKSSDTNNQSVVLTVEYKIDMWLLINQ